MNAVLDRHPIELDRDTYLKRTLALELLRLDELEEAFREKAVVHRDVAAGVLLVKVAERRATLLGLKPPLGHAVPVIHHEPRDRLTSTQHIRGVLDRDQVTAIRDRWAEQSKGLHQGGTPILTGGLKVVPWSTPARDAQLAELSKISSEKICWAFGIPLQLLGLATTPATSTETLMQFWLATGLGFCLNLEARHFAARAASSSPLIGCLTSKASRGLR